MRKITLFIGCLLSTYLSFAQLVGTIAGNGNPAHADGVGTSSSFYHPHDVCTDNSGNIYITDQGNHVVRKIDVNGVVSTLAGAPGITGNQDGTGSNARFNNPTGIAYYNGALFITDYSNHLIRRIDAVDGTVTTLAGNGSQGNLDGVGAAAQLGGPVGICLHSSTELLFTEQVNNKIRKINISTNEVTAFAGDIMGASGSTDGPLATAKFNAPYDVFSSMGVVVVADQSNHKVRLINGGNVSTFAGTGTASSLDGPTLNATFHTPLSLIGNENGELFVLDYGTAIIRKIDQSAMVTSVVGSGYQYADGDFSVARFHSPTGMTFDPNGNLIVADYGNNRIRIVDFDAALGLEDQDEMELRIYPNPASNEVHVQGYGKVESVRVFDLSGSQVLDVNTTTFEVDQLENGVYLIQVIADGELSKGKFMKM